MHTVVTSPTTDSEFFENATLDLGNDACTNRRSMNEADPTFTPERLEDPEIPAYNTTNLPASQRVKRQAKKTKLTPEEIRIDNLKEKQLNLMAQAMYATQELIWPLAPIFKHYENDVPYRMAFIFMKLHTIMREARSIVKLMETKNTPGETRFTDTQRLQIYWQLVRKNMDATYLVDYIIQRVPLGTEGRDTTIPPPTTVGPNTTTVDPNSTTANPNSSGDSNDTSDSSKNTSASRRAYYGKRFTTAWQQNKFKRERIGRMRRARYLPRLL